MRNPDFGTLGCAEVQWRSLLSHGAPFFALVSGDPCGGRARFGLEVARFANTEACALAHGRVVLARSESGFAEVRGGESLPTPAPGCRLRWLTAVAFV